MSSPAISKDFPDWMGPMLIKELRQGMKARAFEASFIVLQVILVLVVSYHALLYGKHAEKFNPAGLHAIFWVIVALQLLLITPLRAISGLSNERKANTLELIFMTGLTSWRIAFGKWASLMFQALLFVLAVLPYAFLRYFFGGVNLTEELIGLGVLILASGLLTAMTLAVSGLPLFSRIGGMILLGLGAMSFLPGLIFGMAMRGTMISFGIGGSIGSYWPLLLFNAVLLGCLALAFAATTIASLAENHMMRQRVMALGFLLPLPVMLYLGADKEAIMSQLVLFGAVGFLLTWTHLSIAPSPLRVHVEPFSKRGLPGFIAGLLFQPGWPSTVLFLALVQGALIAIGRFVLPAGDFRPYCAGLLMGGAALLTPALLWRIRKKPKNAFALQTLVLLVCGLMALFYYTLLSSRGGSAGDAYWTAILPPFGFWMMMDDGGNASRISGWLAAGSAMYGALTLLLLCVSADYWRRLIAFHREIRAAKQKRVTEIDRIAA